jgi:WD40 repeat protein
MLVVYRVFNPDPVDYGFDGSEDMTDSSGRNIRMTEGFLTRSRQRGPIDPGLTHELVSAIHTRVSPAFRQFWLEEDNFQTKFFESIPFPGQNHGRAWPIRARSVVVLSVSCLAVAAAAVTYQAVTSSGPESTAAVTTTSAQASMSNDHRSPSSVPPSGLLASEVNDSVMSPDGTHLATAGKDGVVKVWGVVTGQVGETFTGHAGPVNCVAFSPDGKQLVSGGDDHTLRIWDLDSGRSIRILTGPTSAAIMAAAFSRDGKQVVSGSDDHTLRLWDVDSGGVVNEQAGSNGKPVKVSFSADNGTVIVEGDDGKVTLWNLR